ncbi:MAG TPA: dephospho-CoA kinase [Dongiaceae bacterium]|jgi:dephospho-CoA kinase|nr:dephospho-CoA kinase [Dongiaceae bacterium]
MKVIGLTGSIGMGKSTALAMIARMGIPVFDADKIARLLTAPGGPALSALERHFPDFVRDGIVDRPGLASHVFTRDPERRRLEAVLHPLIAQERERFLRFHMRGRHAMVVLDIPLLYESRLDPLCDAVILVWAPPFLQQSRVLARPRMDAALLAAIRARQMQDSEKKRRADFLLPSGLGRALTFRRLRRIFATIDHA